MLALAALAALLSGFLAACTDDDPLRLSDDESASFSVRPQLSTFGASEMLPINLIRLTVVSLPDSAQVIEPAEFDVEPTDSSWSLHLDVPLAGGQPIEVLVFVELINETDGVRTVEWSGVAGPFSLEPGETAVPPKVEMFRGSVENLAITALAVAGADTTTEGATLVLRATAVGTSTPHFFWSSLDPAVLALDTAAADSATFLPLAPGLARIVVEAGPRADTLEVQVHARVTEIALSPAVDTLTALLANATFGAAALDARGDTVPDVPFVWTSSDSTIARSLGGGVFEARAQGTVTISAATPLAPGLSASAELAVRQDVDSIVVFDPVDTLTSGESTILNAIAVDANDQAVVPSTLAWSSADSTVVAIDSSGVNAVFVTARAAGTTLVQASLEGKSATISVTVVAGTAATLTIAEGDGQAGTVGQLLADSLVVVVEDALGNPVAGATVSFATASGTVSPPSPASDAQGRAVAYWTLGTVAGGVSAKAAVAGDTVIFNATAVAGAVASIDVEPDTLSFAALAQTAQLAATTFDAFGNDCGCAATWASLDAAIATVDASGVVTSTGRGTTWIVANVGSVRDSALVASFPAAAGATIVWTGVASADWLNPVNWNTGMLPTGADTVLVPTEALTQPVLAGVDSIAGLIVDTLTTLDVAGTLTVTSYLLGDGDVGGAGLLRLRDTEVRHSASDGVVRLPSFEAAGQTFLWNRVLATGNVSVPAAAYLELTVGGLQTTGDVVVIGDDASLGAWDSLLVGGSLTIGGAEAISTAYFSNHASVVVDGSLLVTGRGLFEFANAATSLRILGDARWESVMSGEAIMPAGTIEIGGDWHMQGPSFHSPGLQTNFIGTTTQHVTHLDVGHAAGQGHFGPVHVANPGGVVFDTPTLIEGDLTSDAGAAITADTLAVEGDIALGGDLTAVAIDALQVSVGGSLAASSMRLRALGTIGPVYDVAVTTFAWPFADVPLVVDVAPAYQELRIEADTAQLGGTLTVESLFATGVLRGDTLRVSDAFQVDGAFAVALVDFTGAAQSIPALTYQDVQVSGSGASWTQPGAIVGSLTVTGDLALAADLDVGAMTTVVGAIQPAGNTLSTADLTVAGGTGLVMTNPLDSVIVTGAAEFLNGGGGLATGTLLVESGGTFHSVGAAFRSSGTVLHMRGALLDMDNPGPAADQSMLADLLLDSPALTVDSAYVAGNVIERAPSQVIDVAGAGPWRALLRVEGDIATPNTGYAIEHVAVGREYLVSFDFETPDTVEFTGAGQVIPVLVPGAFDPASYGTILVTGTDVHLGADTASYNLTADVVVRGLGTTLTVHTGDASAIRSLRITEGDATTRVVFHEGMSVDSVVVNAGVLDLAGTTLTLNGNGFAATALRTTSSGVVEMNDGTDQLFVLNGDARFEGGSTDGLLSTGLVDMADSTTFYSRGDAFRSTGTALLMRGDTIAMEGAGFGAGQGQLASMQFFEGAGLEVVDSLYITGDLNDAFGAMLHDQVGDALVVVGGDVIADSSQVVVNHVTIGGDLLLTSMSNWAVDTTQFTGNGQLAPLADANLGLIPYNVVLVTGDSVILGTGNENPVLGSIIVRGPGSTLVLNSQEEAMVDALRMEGGDPTQRVRLGNGHLRAASIVVASGVFELNSFSAFVNAAVATDTAFLTTGGGALEMNRPSDWFEVNNGNVFFEGGSTNGLLTDGRIVLTSEFGNATSLHVSGDAFHATGTHVRMDVDSLGIVNGGVAATQARFAGVTFGAQPQAFGPIKLDGHLVVEDSLVDFIGGGSGILGSPASRLTVLGQFRTAIADLDIPHIVAHQNLLAGIGSNVDVAELAGAVQTISDALRMIPDTLLVTGGDVTIMLDSMVAADTLARLVHVRRGTVVLVPPGGAYMDTLLIDDGGLLDPKGAVVTVGNSNTVDGYFATLNGGLLAMQNNEFFRINGTAEFMGGPTDGLLTSGSLDIRGDFYAEKGAFQASGTHLTRFNSFSVGTPATIQLLMPTGGPTPGFDHFNDLALEWTGGVKLGSDLYVIGELSDNSDAGTPLDGAGFTIHSDGWSLNSGLSSVNVTLNMDADLNAERTSAVSVNSIGFGAYTIAMPRMVIRHPGDLLRLTFGNLDFDDRSAGGSYIEAIDADRASPFLTIDVTFGIAPPTDWLARVVETDGAVVNP